VPLPVKHLGPFMGGVVDAANPIQVEGSGRGSYPGLGGKPVVRYARNCRLDGTGRLIVRNGTQLALTLYDDQGVPAPVTSVVALIQFADACLAVGHSTVTSKFYLYWLKADLTDWYNSSKVLQGTVTPAPVAVLWSGVATPSPVLIAEGLNIAYIAHNNPGLVYQTRQFDTTQVPAVLSDYQANLDGTGSKQTFFKGVVSFAQALWGWGYGSQAAGDGVRPELLRFSPPFFAAMQQVDNFAVGHRTRSVLESVVELVVSGQVLYAGTNNSVWPITGYGRDSWDHSRPVDEAFGFWGLRAACAGPNGYLYYWSHRGPMRVLGMNPPEPLWPRISNAILTLVENSQVVSVFDAFADQVVWLYQNATSGGTRVLCAYDVLREGILGPDGDIGLNVGVMALVHPVLTAVPPGPAGPPTTASTTAIGTTVANANWVNGDNSPDAYSQLEVQYIGQTDWTIVNNQIPITQTSYQITGLTGLTNYQWRIKHVRNGINSAYLGPVAGSMFTTIGQLNPPTTPLLATAGPYDNASWVNSGESGVSTEVWYGAPGTETLRVTAPPGRGSEYITIQSGQVDAKMRHVRAGSTASVFITTNTITH
jgi:hypothetical protein